MWLPRSKWLPNTIDEGNISRFSRHQTPADLWGVSSVHFKFGGHTLTKCQFWGLSPSGRSSWEQHERERAPAWLERSACTSLTLGRALCGRRGRLGAPGCPPPPPRRDPQSWGSAMNHAARVDAFQPYCVSLVFKETINS